MKKAKNKFTVLVNEEDFQKKIEEQLENDKKLADFLSGMAEKGLHKSFTFSLLNLGTLLQTISVFFELKQKEIEKIIQLEKEPIKQRKMTVIIHEINEKINLKYDLDEEIEVVKEVFIYDNDSYISIDKILFIKLLMTQDILKVCNLDNDI